MMRYVSCLETVGDRRTLACREIYACDLSFGNFLNKRKPNRE